MVILAGMVSRVLSKIVGNPYGDKLSTMFWSQVMKQLTLRAKLND